MKYHNVIPYMYMAYSILPFYAMPYDKYTIPCPTKPRNTRQWWWRWLRCFDGNKLKKVIALRREKHYHTPNHLKIRLDLELTTHSGGFVIWNHVMERQNESGARGRQRQREPEIDREKQSDRMGKREGRRERGRERASERGSEGEGGSWSLTIHANNNLHI